MPDGKTEWRLKAIETRTGDLAQEFAMMKIMFEKRERDRIFEERKRLWAGIRTLGGIVLTLIGSIWWIVRDILFRAGPP